MKDKSRSKRSSKIVQRFSEKSKHLRKISDNNNNEYIKHVLYTTLSRVGQNHWADISFGQDWKGARRLSVTAYNTASWCRRANTVLILFRSEHQKAFQWCCSGCLITRTKALYIAKARVVTLTDQAFPPAPLVTSLCDLVHENGLLTIREIHAIEQRFLWVKLAKWAGDKARPWNTEPVLEQRVY